MSILEKLDDTQCCLIGGIVPAVCLGLGAVLMRGSMAGGATIPLYLPVVGTTVALVG